MQSNLHEAVEHDDPVDSIDVEYLLRWIKTKNKASEKSESVYKER